MVKGRTSGSTIAVQTARCRAKLATNWSIGPGPKPSRQAAKRPREPRKLHTTKKRHSQQTKMKITKKKKKKIKTNDNFERRRRRDSRENVSKAKAAPSRQQNHNSAVRTGGNWAPVDTLEIFIMEKFMYFIRLNRFKQARSLIFGKITTITWNSTHEWKYPKMLCLKCVENGHCRLIK